MFKFSKIFSSVYAIIFNILLFFLVGISIMDSLMLWLFVGYMFLYDEWLNDIIFEVNMFYACLLALRWHNDQIPIIIYVCIGLLSYRVHDSYLRTYKSNRPIVSTKYRFLYFTLTYIEFRSCKTVNRSKRAKSVTDLLSLICSFCFMYPY